MAILIATYFIILPEILFLAVDDLVAIAQELRTKKKSSKNSRKIDEKMDLKGIKYTNRNLRNELRT